VRLDPWGGFQPYIRFAAQMAGGPGYYASGTKKTGYTAEPLWKVGARKTLSGEIKPLDPTKFGGETRLSQLGRFAGMKLSPQARLVLDLLSGETAMGEPLQSVFGQKSREAITSGDRQRALEQLAKTKEFELFVPMFIQDSMEAFEAEGLTGIALAAPAFYGATVGTYPTPDEARSRSRRKAKNVAETAEELYQQLGQRGPRP
jgi:hypothetical protein